MSQRKFGYKFIQSHIWGRIDEFTLVLIQSPCTGKKLKFLSQLQEFDFIQSHMQGNRLSRVDLTADFYSIPLVVGTYRYHKHLQRPDYNSIPYLGETESQFLLCDGLSHSIPAHRGVTNEKYVGDLCQKKM